MHANSCQGLTEYLNNMREGQLDPVTSFHNEDNTAIQRGIKLSYKGRTMTVCSCFASVSHILINFI